MNVLVSAIRLYQRFTFVNATVRLTVGVHHAVTPRTERGPCPLSPECSKTGLIEAQARGLLALPAILRRMSVCGVMPGDHSYKHYSGCKPPPSLGVMPDPDHYRSPCSGIERGDPGRT